MTIRDGLGNVISQTAYENPYLFTGRRFDDQTGLYYYRARMYSAELGRFLQTDPIGYEDGINWYAYCGNNPIIIVDLFGLCGEKAAQWAESQELNTDYGKDAKNWMGADILVCNQFVCDAYRETGESFPRRWWHRDGVPVWTYPTPSLGPPSANELANPSYKMSQYPVINYVPMNINELKRGDIIAFPSSHGHAAIYIGEGMIAQGSTSQIGASITKLQNSQIDQIIQSKATVRRHYSLVENEVLSDFLRPDR